MIEAINNRFCFFSDKIVNYFWNTILETGNQLITENSDNCSSCNPQCNGCFGPGPQLCQNCINNISGFTCVDICPNGTDFINYDNR